MATAKKKAGKIIPADAKMVECEIIVNQMNVRINKINYAGDLGDKISMGQWEFEKLSKLGFVK